MRNEQEAIVETLRQMQHFLDDNGATFDAVNRSGARKRLDETAEQMATHAVAQIGGRRVAEGETAKLRVLRPILRYDHMRPIATIAGQKLREKPEFKLLRLPRWKVRGAGLTAAARDMANAAEKYTELFVEEGLASDFVAQLRAAADRLDESIVARGQSRRQRAGATEGLKSETKRARAVIRLLDDLVRPKLGANDQLLREWEVASHVQRARRPLTATSEAEASPVPTPRATPSLGLVLGSATTGAAA